MTSRVVSSIATAIGLTLAWSVVATAQPQPQVPVDTAAPAVPPVATALNLNVDLFGAVDESLGSTADVESASNSRRTYWGGNSTLSYERATLTRVFGASGSASYRRFSEISDLAPSYSGEMHMSGRMTRRSRYDLTQTVGYGPTNALSLFGIGELSVGSQYVPTIDYRLLDSSQLATTSRGTVSYSISRRGSVSGAVSFEYAEAPDTTAPVETAPVENDLDATSPTSPTFQASTFRRVDVSARYTNQFSRYMNWYAGYGTTENIVKGDPTAVPRAHTIDAGVAYSRPLAFSRRTRVTGQVGTQMVQGRSADTREWRANGSAGVQHEIGRTWRAQLLYLRDTRFVPLFSDPALTDAVSTSFSGNVTRKSTLGLVANYSQGSVGIETGSNTFHGTSASASYRYAFFKSLGLYAEYFVFDFSFDNGIPLSGSITNDSSRHGLRFGVTMGTGLWGNSRHSPLTLDGDTSQ